MTPTTHIDPKGVNAEVTRHYNNTDQEAITITADKTRIILDEYLEKIESKKSWQLPLSFLLPLILTAVTTETYKSFSFFSAQLWPAIIIVAIFVTTYYLVKAIINSWRSRKLSIDDIINKMKNPPQEEPAQISKQSDYRRLRIYDKI